MIFAKSLGCCATSTIVSFHHTCFLEIAAQLEFFYPTNTADQPTCLHLTPPGRARYVADAPETEPSDPLYRQSGHILETLRTSEPPPSTGEGRRRRPDGGRRGRDAPAAAAPQKGQLTEVVKSVGGAELIVWKRIGRGWQKLSLV